MSMITPRMSKYAASFSENFLVSCFSRSYFQNISSFDGFFSFENVHEILKKSTTYSFPFLSFIDTLENLDSIPLSNLNNEGVYTKIHLNQIGLPRKKGLKCSKELYECVFARSYMTKVLLKAEVCSFSYFKNNEVKRVIETPKKDLTHYDKALKNFFEQHKTISNKKKNLEFFWYVYQKMLTSNLHPEDSNLFLNHFFDVEFLNYWTLLREKFLTSCYSHDINPSDTNYPEVMHAFAKQFINFNYKIWKGGAASNLQEIEKAQKKIDAFKLDSFKLIQSVYWIRGHLFANFSFKTFAKDMPYINSFCQKPKALLPKNSTPSELVSSGLSMIASYRKEANKAKDLNISFLKNRNDTLKHKRRKATLNSLESSELHFLSLALQQKSIKEVRLTLDRLIRTLEEKITPFQLLEHTHTINTFREKIQKAANTLSDRTFSACIIKLFDTLSHGKVEERPFSFEMKQFILNELFPYWVNECQTPFITELSSSFIKAFKNTSCPYSYETLKEQLLNIKKDLDKRIQDLFQILHEGQPIFPTQEFEKTTRASLLAQLNEIPKFRKALTIYQKIRVEKLSEFSKKLDEYSKAAAEDREETLKEIEQAISLSKTYFLRDRKKFLKRFRSEKSKSFQFTPKDETHLRALFQRTLFWKTDGEERIQFKKTLFEIQTKFKESLEAGWSQKRARQTFKGQLGSLYRTLLPQPEELPLSKDLHELFAKHCALFEELRLIHQFTPNRPAPINGSRFNAFSQQMKTKCVGFFN